MKTKTLEERLNECMQIRSKLNELGIVVPDYFKKMNSFVKTGESSSGHIKIPEINRKLHYVFSNNKDRACSAVLKSN
jgi:hypothetical protein